MASLQEVNNWINSTKGKYVDFDGAYGEQCFDLAMKYMKDVFGITTGFPKAGGRAKDIPNAMKGWTGWTIGHWSKASDLQVGDIITWNARPGAADTTWGHVAIYAGNNQKFETNGTGNAGKNPGDNATLRTLVTGGAYMYAPPKLIGNTNTNDGGKKMYYFKIKGNGDYFGQKTTDGAIIIVDMNMTMRWAHSGEWSVVGKFEPLRTVSAAEFLLTIRAWGIKGWSQKR